MVPRKQIILAIFFVFLSSVGADDDGNGLDTGGPSELGIIYSDTFRVQQCDKDADYPVKLTNVVVMPDPIVSPGKMILTLTMNVTEQLFAPISIDLLTQRKMGGRWITMPCLYQFFGSCKYKDLCKMFSKVPFCPKLVQKKTPCKCPIEKNVYEMDAMEFDLDPEQSFVVGEYHSRLFSENWLFSPIMCYLIDFEIVKPRK